MGRPQHVYQLSRHDHLRRTLSDRFPDSHGNFRFSARYLAATVGYDQMSAILQKQWERASYTRDRVGTGSVQEREFGGT